MKTRTVVLGAAMSLIVLAGCAGGDGTGASPGAPAAGGETVEVAIADFAFAPADASAGVGDTVRWTNDDSAPHTVEWADGEAESSDLNNGDEYERTFDTAGTFDYACGIHPQMTGSVTVTQ